MCTYALIQDKREKKSGGSNDRGVSSTSSSTHMAMAPPPPKPATATAATMAMAAPEPRKRKGTPHPKPLVKRVRMVFFGCEPTTD